MAYYLIFETFKLDLNTICHTTTKVGLTFPALAYANEFSLRCNVFLLFTIVFIVSHQLNIQTILKLIQTSSYKPLLDAARSNRQQILLHLLSNGTDVNTQGEKGVTALHIAAEDRNFVLVDVLLGYGADTSIKDHNGNTPLHVASSNGSSAITDILLSRSSDINVQNRFGETSLHLAVKYNNKDVVEVLLNSGARLDIKDFCGETVLHHSVRENNKDIVEILFQCGADITVTNSEGFTPFDIAVQRTEDQMIRQLLPHLVLMRDNKSEIGDVFESINPDPDILDYLSSCEAELSLINTTKIHNTSLFFSDLLNKSSYELVKYARNDVVKQILDSEAGEISFPIYISMMRHNFNSAMKRKALLELCYVKFMKEVSSDLPFLCVKKMFSFFKDFELVDFHSR